MPQPSTPRTPFRERLYAAASGHASWLCVGLDPDRSQVPPGLDASDPTVWVPAFLLEIVAATRDLVCCYKPNLGFFEAFGTQGSSILRRVLDGLPEDVPVLIDAKRGDTPNTMQAYARALFDELGADAVTVSPYLGGDALAPFFAYAERGVFVLCKTSNPGAGEVQDLNVCGPDGAAEPLFVHVARRALSWDRHGTLGLVAGATYPSDVARVRAVAPLAPILLPGVGAQAGDLEQAVQAGRDRQGGNVIVNASRTILYASRGADWAEAARREALRLRQAINAARALGGVA